MTVNRPMTRPRMICLDCASVAPLAPDCLCEHCGSEALFNAAIMAKKFEIGDRNVQR